MGHRTAEWQHGIALLPLGCFVLLWWLFTSPTSSRRVAFLLASITWTTYLVAVTEVLSLARLLALGPLALAWSALLLPLMILVRLRRRQLPAFPTLDRRCRVIAGVLAATLSLLLAVALVAPPNTWDSMSYHMARVAHWVQNRSVAPYATNNARQIHLGPGAEFIILHLQILTGGDRLANAVQWFALVGSMVGTSLIARGLRAQPTGQFFGAALCAGIPMAVCQATSTQNDLVVAFWLVCFVACGFELRAAQPPLRRAVFTVAMGLSLGLAVLTKATALVVAPPFAVLLFFLIPGGLRSRIVRATPVLLLAGLVNAGFFARNYAACGSVLGPGSEGENGEIRYVNELITPATVTSNVLRNLTLELMLPFPAWNSELIDLVRHAHTPMGILPSDKRITFHHTRFSLAGIIVESTHDDTAPAPLLLVLTGLAIAAPVLVRGADWQLRFAYALCIVAAFVLFCTVLKWQPWHARLHLPMFVLACPLVGAAIERYVKQPVQLPIVLLVLLAAMPAALLNPARPVLRRDNVFTMPRESQYLMNRPYLRPAFEATALSFASAPVHRVGLDASSDAWEYPLWVLLRRVRPDVHIEHVGVQNYTARFAERFEPDAIIHIDNKGRPALTAPPPARP